MAIKGRKAINGRIASHDSSGTVGVVVAWRARLTGGAARALRKPDREAFDELMDMCRKYASESGNATNSIIFEPMIISILLGQQKRLLKLEQELKVFEKTQQA